MMTRDDDHQGDIMNIYVGKLAFNVTEADLRATFEAFGAVASALKLELDVQCRIPGGRVYLNVKGTDPAGILSELAARSRCSWQIEGGRLSVRPQTVTNPSQ